MPKELLTAKHVENAKPRPKAYRLRDSDGLFLYVPPSGVNAWQFRYKLNGVWQSATFGRADRITLAEARAMAEEARKQVAQGLHLTTEKRLTKARVIAATAATFGEYAEAWVETEYRRARWTPDYREEVAASIKNHLSDLALLPVAGNSQRRLPQLRCYDALSAVPPDMAKKVRQRLRGISIRRLRMDSFPTTRCPRRGGTRAGRSVGICPRCWRGRMSGMSCGRQRQQN